MKKIELSDSALLTAFDLLNVFAQVAEGDVARLIDDPVDAVLAEMESVLNSRGYHLVCHRKGELGL